MSKLGLHEIVKCDICGAIYIVESEKTTDSYIEVLGNIMIGNKGGVIGHNFDNDMRLNNSFVCCNNKICLTEFFKMIDVKHCTNISQTTLE